MDTAIKDRAKDQDEKILLPYEFFAKVIVKHNFITKLLTAINGWLRVPENKLSIIMDITSMIYSSTLVIDDIEDNSRVREGTPTSHSIYGIPASINATNHITLLCIKRGVELNNPEAINILIECGFDMTRGQGMEIYWRENQICPDEEEYCKIAIQKASGILMVGIKLMQLFSEDKRDFSEFIYNLGLYLQLTNDYVNLSSDEYMKGKMFCEDLTEGKYSFPIIHAIKNQPKHGIVEKILHQRTSDMDVKKHCLSLIKEYGSLEYTKGKIEELDKKLRDNLRGFPKNLQMIKLLDFPQVY